ncbi:MAG: hypothetical protein VW741_00650 [Flammeovirgaceae bacterium]
MHKIVFLFLFYFIFSESSFSQFSKSETAPPNIKWHFKKSENFTIFFPKELDSIANYSISFLENNINDIKVNPNDKIRRSRIILHNQNSIPNAFVASSPRRSEFFVNAKPESPHFLHNNNWVDLLSVHEYRHLVQRELGHNNFFNKVVFFLFGEGLSSMLIRSSTPNWYWEGDAVYTETSIGNYGRGRIPRFLLTTQMNVMSKNKIKYERQTLGSFKFKTPNEYESGYLMVKHIKNNYGESVYNKIVNKAHKQSFLPVPFYRALKKETGLNYKTLYLNSLNTLSKKSLVNKVRPINKRKNKTFTSFLYPKQISENKIVVLREGYGSYQDFRIINEYGDVSLLFTPGVVNDFGRIPYSNEMVAWLEFDKDPRWDKRVFSSVKILDINSKKLLKKSLKGFFSSIDLSLDGKRLLVAKNYLDGSQGFEEYDLSSMKKIKEKRFGLGVVSSLKYHSNKKLIGVKTVSGVKTVFLFDLEKNEMEEVYKSSKNIGWPSIYDEKLILSLEKRGFEEIVCINLNTKEVLMVKETPLGNYYPSIYKNKILFSSMGEFGFDVYSTKLEQLESISNIEEPLYPEQNPQKETIEFMTKKASVFMGLVSPVSWGISDYGISEKGLDNITLGLESTNLFGTLMFNGGHKIDIRDKKHKNYFGLSYQAFFPIIDFTLSSSNDYFNQNIVLTNSVGDRDTIYNADINFKIRELTPSLRVPLSFTKGKFFTSLLASFGYSHQKFKNFYTTALTSDSGKFPLITNKNTRAYLSGLLLYSRKHKKSRRQVYNPYEQTLILEAKSTTNNSDYNGRYLRSDLYLAFPGIKNLHSTRLRFRGESQSNDDYLFRNNVNFIYGYDNNFRFSTFLGWGLEYELPLLYPDFSIGPIAYIQRIRGIGFINGGTVEGSQINGEITFKESPKSVGFGVVLDMNLFRQSFMFDLGIKYAYVYGVNDLEKGPSLEISLGSITF